MAGVRTGIAGYSGQINKSVSDLLFMGEKIAPLLLIDGVPPMPVSTPATGEGARATPTLHKHYTP